VSAPPASPHPNPLRYWLGVAITIAAILSQYAVPQSFAPARFLYDHLAGDLFVVYGIPILAFALLVGIDPLRGWRARLGRASWEGLRWFGALAILGILVGIGLAIVYAILDPSALNLLSRPNPDLTAAQGDPWFFVALSFLVGACEETIFRGWIYGAAPDRRARWWGAATWTSVVFAGVHLYYGTTYGAAAPLIFPSLFLLGFAFAATYEFAGGNLVVPALLHGAYDAAAYLTLVNQVAGNAVRYGLILLGGLIALIEYLRPSAAPPSPSASLPSGPT
jgi:membrane protease YdiL (CAAX protease family)